MYKNKKRKSLLLKDVISLFTDEKQMENISESSITFYKYNLSRFLAYIENSLCISEPTCKDYNLENIDKFRKMLKSKKKWDELSLHRKNEKISDNSYRTYTNAIRVFGNWMYQKGYISEDILNSIKLPKMKDKHIRMLSDQETNMVFDQFNLETELGLRNYIICWLALDLGLRAKSIATIKLSDVDFKNNNFTAWLKGNKTATYPLSKELRIKMREYILLYRKKVNISTDSLFLNRDGSGVTTNTIKQLFKKMKKMTGINEIGCHMLRHNFATNYALDGHTMEETQYVLGHTTESMAKKYVHTAKHLNFTGKHTSRLSRLL